MTVATSTWYNLRLEGTKDVVNFWVSSDDGVTWTFIGYCTSNIVTTSARASGLGAYLRKVGGSTGTTSVTAYVGKCVYWPPRMN